MEIDSIVRYKPFSLMRMEDYVLNHISDHKCLEHLSFQTSSNISRPVNMLQQLIKKSKSEYIS